MYSNHLNRKKSITLDFRRGAGLMDRVNHEGQNLVALSYDLGADENGDHNTQVRILDEETGRIRSQIFLPNPATGKFGLSQEGRLKLLLTGYEIFGVIDIDTKNLTRLRPDRSQPSLYPAEVKTSIGTMMSIREIKPTFAHGPKYRRVSLWLIF